MRYLLSEVLRHSVMKDGTSPSQYFFCTNMYILISGGMGHPYSKFFFINFFVIFDAHHFDSNMTTNEEIDLFNLPKNQYFPYKPVFWYPFLRHHYYASHFSWFLISCEKREKKILFLQEKFKKFKKFLNIIY